MTTALLYWVAASVMFIGQILLIRAAWRLRIQPTTDTRLPRSNVQADLGWTIATAVLTMVLFVAAYPLAIGQ